MGNLQLKELALENTIIGKEIEISIETLDMTDAAKKIINCVYEAKGRYGKGIIIDTVSGAKTARLKEIGAVNYKSYGVLATINKNLLRRLME